MATKFNSSSSINNFKWEVQVETRRLRGLNPHVVVMGQGLAETRSSGSCQCMFGTWNKYSSI